MTHSLPKQIKIANYFLTLKKVVLVRGPNSRNRPTHVMVASIPIMVVLKIGVIFFSAEIGVCAPCKSDFDSMGLQSSFACYQTVLEWDEAEKK